MKLIGILAAFTVALVVFGGSQLTDSFWASAAAVDPTAMPTPEDPQPVYTSYKGVTVGMSQDDARAHDRHNGPAKKHDHPHPGGPTDAGNDGKDEQAETDEKSHNEGDKDIADERSDPPVCRHKTRCPS